MDLNNMVLTVTDPEDIEELFRLFDELRDCQDDLSKLPKYCSGWTEANLGASKVFTRRPIELNSKKVLHAGVRVVGPRKSEILIRIGEK